MTGSWRLSLKWRVLWALAFAELLVMSLWFSATAVIPSLITVWHLTPGEAAWLTMMVQLGFVTGAVLAALTNVADLYAPRFVFATGAFVGASANAVIPLVEPDYATVLLLRFVTGMSLAAVYPVGMKIMATWTREDRGLGLGLLVGALTVGSASPHLVRGLGGIADWQGVLLTVSAFAAVGGVVGGFAGRVGPYYARAPRFRLTYMKRALTDPALRLANLGYLGHMWELYAMWTWIPIFLAHAMASAGGMIPAHADRAAAFTTFAVIGIGGVSSFLAGLLADRWGRTRTTIASMILSGSCATAIGWFADASIIAVGIIAIVWGFAVIADSAQFSTAVSELGDREYMGTLLTTQTAMGFLLTMASIRLVPWLVDRVGWTGAFASLAIGPLIGTLAMWRLKQSPAAEHLAGGRG